jgi:uncharacterized MnhB-related membrane protein
MMTLFKVLLLFFLIGCATAVSLTKRLLSSVIIFMSYSLVMSALWGLLEAPDLAVTEAAVGAGITSVLFFFALKRVRKMREEDNASSD